MSRFLHETVHNLSAREKAYFKRFSKLHGDSDKKAYIQLFDALLEMSIYDFEKLKKQFAESSFANRITAQLAYLNEQLLKSLANFYLDSSPNFSLQKSILFIEVLNKKGHKKHSQRLLRKAKKTAHNIEDFTTILKLIQLEEEILFKQGILKFKDQLEKLKNERFKLYESINAINELRLILEKIRDLFFDKVFDIDGPEYEEIFNHRLLVTTPENLCSKAKKHWYYIHMWKYFINLQFDQAMQACIACLKQMNDYKLIFSREKTLPIYSNLLMLAALCDKEQIFMDNYKLLSQFDLNPPEDKNYLQYIKVVRFLEWTYQTRDKQGTSKSLSENTGWLLSKSKEMAAVQSNHCFFLYVRGYVDLGNFDEALEWHKRLIENGIQKFTIIHTKIISLIVHLELGWLEILESEFESARKTLIRYDKFYLFAQTFIGFIRKVVKDPSNELSYQKQLKKEIKSLKTLPQHNRIFIYFDYERWCDQRIERISNKKNIGV